MGKREGRGREGRTERRRKGQREGRREKEQLSQANEK